MDPISESLKTRLKELRERERYSLKHVANYLGIAVGLYQHYEAGRSTLRINLIVKLKELYCLDTIDELIFGTAGNKNQVIQKYKSLPLEKRRIVDYILEN